eukprot:TRINITY_DN13093_c0_g2_i1.p1 TRINITY_DN13093_c0_g2~~TRINITY_DN13093_c0_g2_i1.p1  ORF type:complete len:223 (-),score=26.11 TRINITY_DN13093_c0_g2_i1:190-858(-)
MYENAKNQTSELCAPLTSLHWNEINPSLIGTSSIDTTCTIWNIEIGKPTTQLVAHDKEVYDVSFSSKEPDVFASVGADGSARLFDLRNLEHSTVIYETTDLTALIRLSWNKQDPNYLATMMADSPTAIILDLRVPSIPVTELNRHQRSLNALSWAPHSSCHICTASDDRQVLIWDVGSLPGPVPDPFLGYTAKSSVSQVEWSSSQPEWLSIAFGKTLEILRV